MSDTLRNAYAILKDNRLSVSPELVDTMDRLSHPLYRIAVIGKFQTGKSTFINQVFLDGGPLFEEKIADNPPSGGDANASLVTGVGRCTTAVTTEVAFGETPVLEVYPWKTVTDSANVDVEGEGKKQITVEVREAPGTPKVIANPTPKDVAEATTAFTDMERLEKSRSIAYAKLLWPREELADYVLLDTPGIDDPIPEIINNTTYRVVPGADTAIIILEPKMLEQAELDFLRSKVFSSGLTRILALVSYKPNRQKIGSAARQEILDAIKAQLHGIGRETIPVELYCFDESVEGAALNSPEKIRGFIMQYLLGSVGASRSAKAAHLLRAALRNALISVKTKEAMLRKSEDERREAARRIASEEKNASEQFDRLTREIGEDIDDIRHAALSSIRKGLSDIVNRHNKEFDSCQSIADVQKKLKSLNAEVKPDVEDVLFRAGEEAKIAIRRLATQYGDKVSVAMAPLRETMTTELELNPGLLASIPETLVVLVDYWLTTVILPTPFFIDIFLRWLAEKSDAFRNILPTTIARDLMIRYVRGMFSEQVEGAGEKMLHHVEEAFASIKRQTSESIRQIWRDESGAVRDSLTEKATVDDEAEKRRLEKMRCDLEQAMRSLEA